MVPSCPTSVWERGPTAEIGSFKDLVPLAGFENYESGGWNPYSRNAYTSGIKAGSLNPGTFKRNSGTSSGRVDLTGGFSGHMCNNSGGFDRLENPHQYDLASLSEHSPFPGNKDHRPEAWWAARDKDHRFIRQRFKG